MTEPDRKRRASAQNPMDEENFPTRSPTRDAVEREMKEPSNVRGPAHPSPARQPPVREADVESEGEEKKEPADEGGPENTTH